VLGPTAGSSGISSTLAPTGGAAAAVAGGSWGESTREKEGTAAGVDRASGSGAPLGLEGRETRGTSFGGGVGG